MVLAAATNQLTLTELHPQTAQVFLIPADYYWAVKCLTVSHGTELPDSVSDFTAESNTFTAWSLKLI